MHTRMRLWCAAGVVGLIAAASGPQSASAQNLQSVIRTLDNVLNPNDARRFEDQARRNGRADEERYWRDYRAGLETRRPERGIGPDEARRFEEQSRRNHRADEERYWRDYRAGFETRRPERGIGPDEAYRFEEQSRRNHRAEEERYWRDYRAGLDGRGRDRDVYERGRDRGEPRDRFDPTQPR
jgi:hypothetical protein